MRFPAKITSSCIWVAIPVDWVILHWYACGADGRSLGRAVGVRSRDYQILSDVSFLTHGAPLVRFARESSAMTTATKFSRQNDAGSPALTTGLIGWFSNRTGTSFDDGKARGNDLIRLPVPNLPLGHWSSQLFDLNAPSSTDVHVLFLNQPRIEEISYSFYNLKVSNITMKMTDVPSEW